MIHKETIVTASTIKAGKILKMPLEKEDGVTIKGNYNSTLKYFVVIGQVVNHGIVGVFLINSKVNPKAMVEYQFPLFEKDYPDVLEYNSFLDCGNIFELSKIKLMKEGLEIGELTEKDFGIVIEIIEKSEVISQKDKKKFGFEDKS